MNSIDFLILHKYAFYLVNLRKMKTHTLFWFYKNCFFLEPMIYLLSYVYQWKVLLMNLVFILTNQKIHRKNRILFKIFNYFLCFKLFYVKIPKFIFTYYGRGSEVYTVSVPYRSVFLKLHDLTLDKNHAITKSVQFYFFLCKREA